MCFSRANLRVNRSLVKAILTFANKAKTKACTRIPLLITIYCVFPEVNIRLNGIKNGSNNNYECLMCY